MFTNIGVARPNETARTSATDSFYLPSSGGAASVAALERRLWLRSVQESTGPLRAIARGAEWTALSKEEDPAFFDAAVLQLARRAEAEGRRDAAALLAAGVAGFRQKSQFAGRARADLESLSGGGGLGARTESWIGRFSAEALDPAVLAGFFAGGLAFRLGRAWALGRLASSSAPGILGSPLVRRSAAALFGFGVEVPAFVLTARGTGVLLGRPGAWEEGGLVRDLASAAVVLGPMKLVAAGGAALATRALPPASSLRGIFAGTSALGGIFLGHRLEQALGLKPPQAAALTLLDSVVLLLQARVGGGMLEVATGGRLGRWEREMDWRARPMAPSGSPAAGPGMAWAGARGDSASTSATLSEGVRPPHSGISLMSAVRDGGFSGRSVAFERGALAWGGSGALEWLLEVRRHHERQGYFGKSKDLELWWIPESPVDTLLLNDFGVRYRREQGHLERVNLPGRAAVRAFWPVLKKGEAFVHTADLSSALGRVLNQWTEREDSGMRGLLTPQWLELQIDNLCRLKPGFVEKVREGEREYLIFEKGRRQLLPPNLSLFAGPNDPRHVEARASVRYFQNQFWERTPAEAISIFGERLGEELARGAVISQFLDPRALLLPTWAGPRGMGHGTRFFFIQGLRTWMAEASGPELRDVTASEHPARLGFLRDLAIPQPQPKAGEGEAAPTPERSEPAAAKVDLEAPGTTKYPVENYPEAVFGAGTVPYPEMYPKAIEPEVSLPMTTRHRAATPLPAETGPTEKIPESEAVGTAPVFQPRPPVLPRVMPLPAPEPTGKASGAAVPVFQKDRVGLEPTLELPTDLAKQMLGVKPLPFDDTQLMSQQQIALARQGSEPPRAGLRAVLSDLGQAWRQRAWIWTELRLTIYRWLGRTPPAALQDLARSYRESFKK